MELNVTKAYITQIPDETNNIFKVRVPIMEDGTDDEAIFDALLCTSPSTYGGYAVGDCVYVIFEDTKYNTCVILGKLFTTAPKETSAYVLANELKVTDNAILPPSTKLGSYTAQDITNLMNAAQGGGGTGNVSDEDLKEYVKYIPVERLDEQDKKYSYYAKNIMCMTGEEYVKTYVEASEKDRPQNTLFFCTSVPEIPDASV